MNRSLVIVLGALALGAAVFAGSYLIAQRASVAYCANPADDLSWIRAEFHLNDAEMARIRQLHEGYQPQCMKMCALIAAKETEVQTALANGTNVTAVKAALQLMGEDCGPTRAPSAWPLTDVQMTELRRLLVTWNLVSAKDSKKRHAG